MRWLRAVPLVLLGGAACRELPLELPPIMDEPDVLGASTTSTAVAGSCSRSWAAGTSGDWNDPMMWIPAGVPASSDDVCLNAPGTYTVTLATNADINSLDIGGAGAAVKLALSSSSPLDALDVTLDLNIRDGSRLTLVGSDVTVEAYHITNRGLMRVSCASCNSLAAIIAVSILTNFGAIDLQAPTSFGLANDKGTAIFSNNGSIMVTGAPSHVVPASPFVHFIQSSGSIEGSQTLDFINVSSSVNNALYIWSGGTFGALSSDTTRAVVRVNGFAVALSDAIPSGFLEVVGESEFGTTTISGSIQPNVRLRLNALAEHAFDFGSSFGLPFPNSGLLEITTDGAWSAGNNVDLIFPALTNNGEIDVTTAGLVRFDLDSLVNNGSIVSEDTLRILTGRQSVLRNTDSISFVYPGRLEMAIGTTYHAGAGSVMTGSLYLSDATLEGLGTVGDVISSSSRIEPGDPIGTLTASSVVMDPRTTLRIEAADSADGSYDRLVVLGNVAFGGAALDIASVPPFAGGLCGHVLTVITDNTSGSRGAFGKLIGFAPSPVTAWRLHDPPTLLQLVGYNPIPAIFAHPDSVTATEGGPSGAYAVCLGQVAPAADVVVTTTRGSTQIEVFPGTLTFNATDWILPRFVTVVAINDTVEEGLLADIVTHSISSADPVYTTAFLGAVDVAIVDNDGTTSVASPAAAIRRWRR